MIGVAVRSFRSESTEAGCNMASRTGANGRTVFFAIEGLSTRNGQFQNREMGREAA